MKIGPVFIFLEDQMNLDPSLYVHCHATFLFKQYLRSCYNLYVYF